MTHRHLACVGVSSTVGLLTCPLNTDPLDGFYQTGSDRSRQKRITQSNRVSSISLLEPPVAMVSMDTTGKLQLKGESSCPNVPLRDRTSRKGFHDFPFGRPHNTTERSRTHFFEPSYLYRYSCSLGIGVGYKAAVREGSGVLRGFRGCWGCHVGFLFFLPVGQRNHYLALLAQAMEGYPVCNQVVLHDGFPSLLILLRDPSLQMMGQLLVEWMVSGEAFGNEGELLMRSIFWGGKKGTFQDQLSILEFPLGVSEVPASFRFPVKLPNKFGMWKFLISNLCIAERGSGVWGTGKYGRYFLRGYPQMGSLQERVPEKEGSPQRRIRRELADRYGCVFSRGPGPKTGGFPSGVPPKKPNQPLNWTPVRETREEERSWNLFLVPLQQGPNLSLAQMVTSQHKVKLIRTAREKA